MPGIRTRTPAPRPQAPARIDAGRNRLPRGVDPGPRAPLQTVSKPRTPPRPPLRRRWLPLGQAVPAPPRNASTYPSAAEQWTHYYKKTKQASQFDYLLLSPELAVANPKAKPTIDRKGLGTDIDKYQGPRYTPKLTGVQGASDHCPVFMTLEV